MSIDDNGVGRGVSRVTEALRLARAGTTASPNVRCRVTAISGVIGILNVLDVRKRRGCVACIENHHREPRVSKARHTSSTVVCQT